MLNNILATAATAVDAATATTATGAGDAVSMVLMMVIMIAVFYFMLIRPQRKKDKKIKEMLDNLKVSDRICTIGGIYGTIADIKDDTITLTVGRDNMSMVVTRWAIRSVEDVTIENESEALN